VLLLKETRPHLFPEYGELRDARLALKHAQEKARTS
jgi:hypothetical protein